MSVFRRKKFQLLVLVVCIIISLITVTGFIYPHLLIDLKSSSIKEDSSYSDTDYITQLLWKGDTNELLLGVGNGDIVKVDKNLDVVDVIIYQSGYRNNIETMKYIGGNKLVVVYSLHDPDNWGFGENRIIIFDLINSTILFDKKIDDHGVIIVNPSNELGVIYTINGYFIYDLDRFEIIYKLNLQVNNSQIYDVLWQNDTVFKILTNERIISFDVLTNNSWFTSTPLMSNYYLSNRIVSSDIDNYIIYGQDGFIRFDVKDKVSFVFNTSINTELNSVSFSIGGEEVIGSLSNSQSNFLVVWNKFGKVLSNWTVPLAYDLIDWKNHEDYFLGASYYGNFSILHISSKLSRYEYLKFPLILIFIIILVVYFYYRRKTKTNTKLSNELYPPHH